MPPLTHYNTLLVLRTSVVTAATFATTTSIIGAAVDDAVATGNYYDTHYHEYYTTGHAYYIYDR